MSSPAAQPPLLLAWPTAGRRACLADSIECLAENAAAHGRKASFLVVTDGEGDGLRPGLPEDIGRLRERFGLPVEIFNRKSREKFLAEYGRDFDRTILEYALFPSPDGPGWGCNVNASMLKAAGRLLVSTDDDILCRPTRAAGARVFQAPVFSTEYDPGDLLYYGDRGSLLAAVEGADVDVLGAHLASLGADPATLLGPDSGAPERGRVLMANPGTYGDMAMGSASSRLLLEGASREHLMAGGYEALRYSRELLRIPPRTVLSTSAQLIMAQTGFDDRVPLPPFLPYGRNPDGACALLTRLLYPESLTAYLDFGLLHDPPERRSTGKGDLCGFRTHLAALVMSVAARYRPPDSLTGPADRFAALGGVFGEAAALKRNVFVDLAYDAWSMGVQGYVEMLEALLDRHGRSPASWAADVEEHLDAVNVMLREPTLLFGESGCGIGVDAVRRHFDRYGRLLAAWPDLHAACARANGSVA